MNSSNLGVWLAFDFAPAVGEKAVREPGVPRSNICATINGQVHFCNIYEVSGPATNATIAATSSTVQ